jgi:hypothetical protein
LIAVPNYDDTFSSSTSAIHVGHATPGANARQQR